MPTSSTLELVFLPRTTAHSKQTETHWPHEELTERIIGLGFQVADELGHGFLETVYHSALIIALRQEGLEKSPPSARSKSASEVRSSAISKLISSSTTLSSSR